jgi:ribonuclease HI
MELYTDGGCSPNPGRMAIAALLYDGDREVDRVVEVLGHGTNNVAEYQAIIAGLKMARRHTNTLVCYSDSQLTIQQLQGKWRVRKPHLFDLMEAVFDIVNGFRSVEFRSTSREHGRIRQADALLLEARGDSKSVSRRET